MRIISLNLNGIRSAWQKGAEAWIRRAAPEVIAFQELKAQMGDLSPAMLTPEGYHAFYHPAVRKGYSGVGLWCRQKPLAVSTGMGDAAFDAEGRFLRVDFADFSVISLYLPSGSASPERQADKFRFLELFLPRLEALLAEGREMVICGDWNIAHQEIDLKNWKGNRKNSGFLPEEREWFSRMLALGWQDVFRACYPEAGESAYTWWSNRGQARAKNVGWRIDYQIATPGLAARAREGFVYKVERFSDHAPLVLDYAEDPGGVGVCA
ncbi:MAG: exodeoxyribonuclease III [Zoogloeaceae bacterium]|nr:exodeoxyribonuclease III [Zoogloeaceae bacterium]